MEYQVLKIQSLLWKKKGLECPKSPKYSVYPFGGRDNMDCFDSGNPRLLRWKVFPDIPFVSWFLDPRGTKKRRTLSQKIEHSILFQRLSSTLLVHYGVRRVLTNVITVLAKNQKYRQFCGMEFFGPIRYLSRTAPVPFPNNPVLSPVRTFRNVSGVTS